MPIGASKVGVMGAGLVPGGSQTFNASGTFTVPPGVKKVNITGKGGTGNPGNAGNAGNPGNAGSGGGGGSGGGFRSVNNCGGAGGNSGYVGGLAWAEGIVNSSPGFFAPGPASWPGPNSPVPAPFRPSVSAGGGAPNPSAPGANCWTSGNAAQSGNSGNAGTAGNAGNPGNTGGTSSGLCKNFTGGAGGNAGAGGAAGNGGSGGPAGGQGGDPPSRNPGAGGTGGGAGGAGAAITPPIGRTAGSGGGGGAGVTNDGSAGRATTSDITPSNPFGVPNNSYYAKGGTNANVSAPTPSPNEYYCYGAFPRPPATTPVNQTGGIGGSNNNPQFGGCSPGFMSLSLALGTLVNQQNTPTRTSINSFSGNSLPSMFRSGGGGGGVRGSQNGCPIYNPVFQFGGGGGGGGRGNAGNAGGASSTPSGSAATPATFNCVPVTPGSPYPITVATPGGQVVISWNPQ